MCSCGDDGRIRGWNWKDCTQSEVPFHSQGDIGFRQMTAYHILRI